MAIVDDINLEINKNRTKKQKLEKFRDQIELMISNKIPISKQLNILLDNKNEVGIDKLDLTEYRNIIIKNFGYITNKKQDLKIATKKPIKKPISKSAKEILSEEINLF